MLDASKATWVEIEKFVNHKTIAILPFGALEQHGGHLSLSTDTVIASGLAYQVAKKIDALLLPAIPYGESWNNSGFPGTISFSNNTIIGIVEDIGNELQRIGIQTLIVINGHFGNIIPINLAAKKLSEKNVRVLILNHPGLEELAEQICESKPAAPSFYHADEVETSIMLALEPTHVQMDNAKPEYPKFPQTFASEKIRLDQFCQSGVFGDPRPSTSQKGKKLLDGLVINCIEIIWDFVGKGDDK